MQSTPLTFISLITLLFYFINPFRGLSQEINSGITYNGLGSQQVFKSVVDHQGNRYSVVEYTNDFQLDSAGVYVTILATPSNGVGYDERSLAILKYDSLNRYQYCLRVSYYHNAIQSLNLTRECITFDYLNNLIFSGSFSYADSVIFFNANGSQSRRIKKDKVNGIICHDKAFICKVNTNGQFQWINSLGDKKWDINIQPDLNRVRPYEVAVDSNNQILLSIGLDKFSFKGQQDTLKLTDNVGNEQTVIINKDRQLFLFSTTGALVKHSLPFQTKLQQEMYGNVLNIVTDGTYTYTLMYYNLPTPDTLIAPVLLPLSTACAVLVKSTDFDSIMWAKKVSQGTMYRASLDLGQNGEIFLAATILSSNFLLPEDPSLAGVGLKDIFIGSYSTMTGFLAHYNMLTGGGDDNINGISVEKNNQLFIVATTSSTSVDFANFNLPTNNNSLFTMLLNANIDSCVFSEIVLSSSAVVEGTKGIGIGYPFSDKRGKIYLSGWYNDSIVFPCQTLRANQNTEGFVLITSSVPIAIDTTVCQKMQAPSGRYVWDSTATYKDTIMNSKGCDSVITIHLTVLQTEKKLDSSVCKSMLSYSRKYSWDSSGTYLDTIPNSKGCDSIITVNLIVLQTTGNLDTTTCSVYASPSGRYLFDSSGTYFDTILNARGCDSIIRIRYNRLTVTSHLDTMSCSAYKSPSGRYTYHQSGIFFDTIPSFLGCDSIITIDFALVSSQSTISYTICDSVVSPSKKYVYTLSGTYTDTLTGFLGCDSIITIQIVSKPLLLSLSKSNDVSCDTPWAQLYAKGGYDFLWTPREGLSNARTANPIATPQINTVYYVRVNDSLGCSAKDSIEIKVNKTEILKDLANVFTPNGDGHNDCLTLKSIGLLKSISLTIYNRWGNLVFNTSDPEACWDGKDAQGNDVSEGVYFFIAEGVSECETEIKQQGTIHLIR